MTKENISKPIILLVDDNPHNLQVLGRILQEEKYRTEFAINGRSALEWINKKKFDLILLDLNMPEMNGFEVCKKIRAQKDTHEVPIIFLSAESERESILKGFEAGAQDFVTKPFDTRELLARVKTHLDLKLKTENLERVNQWLGKKIDNWLKSAMANRKYDKTENLSEKLDELDKNQNLLLNAVCLEMKTAIDELDIIIGNAPADIKKNSKRMIQNLKESLGRLEKIRS